MLYQSQIDRIMRRNILLRKQYRPWLLLWARASKAKRRKTYLMSNSRKYGLLLLWAARFFYNYAFCIYMTSDSNAMRWQWHGGKLMTILMLILRSDLDWPKQCHYIIRSMYDKFLPRSNVSSDDTLLLRLLMMACGIRGKRGFLHAAADDSHRHCDINECPKPLLQVNL